MKKNPALLLFAIMIFSFLFGCYGLQNPAECATIQDPIEQMACYKRAAVGYAYAGDDVGVRVMCNQIITIGSNYAQQGYEDIEKNARLETNRCYYESAKIIATTEAKKSAITMCDEITESRSVFGLSYAENTKEECKNEVNKLLQFTPEKYYNTPGNICALSGFFIMLLVAFFIRSVIHEL